MTEPLTEEQLGEYCEMLKRGEVSLDEVIAGLICVHGAKKIEGTMTPEEYRNWLLNLGVPAERVAKLFEDLR